MSEAPESHPDDNSQEMFARLKAEISPSTPPIDPTANVLSLVSAAMRRQDDLRASDNKRHEDIRTIKEDCEKETNELRDKLSGAESKRIDALNLAESRRIDAVLQEMKAAVALASEKTTAGASQLAQSVLAAAATTAASIENMRATFDTRTTRVEQQQYQSGGRDIQRESGSNALRDNIGLIVGVLGLIGGLLIAFWK